MTDMIYPTITFVAAGSKVARVLGIDASKAPSFSERFNASQSPEEAVKIVNECIELSVPMWIETVGPWVANEESDMRWAIVKDHAVASIDCLPYE